MEVRRFAVADTRRVWALQDIPHIGESADPTAPLDLPTPDQPPTRFTDLADIQANFLDCGGDFVVVVHEGHLVGMGGVRANDRGQAEVLRVRVHPAMRRQGVGRMLMDELERRAKSLGFAEMHLDTATNQPEAVAFYRGLGYTEVGTETRPEWHWTLVYFTKPIA